MYYFFWVASTDHPIDQSTNPFLHAPTHPYTKTDMQIHLHPPTNTVHNFLDAFYLSRIGIRMLIGQYLELREPPKPDHIGLVCLVCA
jgi:hypothetical protein